MVVFSTLAFQGFVSGTANVYTSAELCELIASVERVSVVAVVTGSTGTSATLTCQFENSPDGTRWMNQAAVPELNAEALTGGHQAIEFTNSEDALVQSYVRMRMALGGVVPTATLRVWLVGRSPAGPFTT